jgi:photosystem II stability/assembly factor-like uncharacterized protein
MRIFLPAVLILAAISFKSGTMAAQWIDLHSGTTSGLRGIDATAKGVVWASGADGTILRSVDEGTTWNKCAVPQGAAKLDFRGVQASDPETAVVMSSGKGDLSRIYKTVDGCKTWKLVFTNPDASGFFDAIRHVTGKQFYLLGDPVDGKFAMFFSQDGGDSWFATDDPGLDAPPGASAFAASNSALASLGPFLAFGTGGTSGAAVYTTYAKCATGKSDETCPLAWRRVAVPVGVATASGGVFSVAGRTTTAMNGKLTVIWVAVGGDFSQSGSSSNTAALSTDGGATWTAATQGPAGYRSALTYSAANWLTVGPGGTDLSVDNGKTWKPVPGEAGGWNAVSMPFAVGPNGRIGHWAPANSSH